MVKIAYDPDFMHPQHFTRLFKQKVRYSPSEYRQLKCDVFIYTDKPTQKFS